MVKRYANLSLIYALLALAFGVFYREFTKYNHFEGRTALSVIHPHFFVLGMVFFLLLMLLEKSFGFSGGKRVSLFLILYQVGLNVSVLGFLLRGLTDVWQTALSSGMDASISGLSGLGHTVLGVSLVLLLLQIRKSAVRGTNP